MLINQDVIDNTIVGLLEYTSVLSDDYLSMIIIDDLKQTFIMDKLMYLTNLKRSIINYDYSSGYFTDAELQHFLEQITIASNELPNNSNYGGRT